MVWMISLKKKYVDAFLNAKKRVEIRAKIPKELCSGDVILCAESGSNGQVVFWFEVTKVYRCSPQFLWAWYHRYLCIDLDDYIAYASGRRIIYGLYVEKIKKIPQGITIADFGLSKSPQWFTSIQTDNKKILKHNAL